MHVGIHRGRRRIEAPYAPLDSLMLIRWKGSQFLAHVSGITPIRVIRVDRVLKVSIILRERNEVSQFP